MAKWGSNDGGMRLPAGTHTAAIVDVKLVESEQRKLKGQDPEQFEWSLNVWLNGKWEPRKMWTGCAFRDPATIKEVKFTPKLMKLVRACGQKLPVTQAEAEAWAPSSLCGHRFGILMQANPEDPTKLIDYIVAAPGQAANGTSATPAQVSAPTPSAPVSTPVAPTPTPPPSDPFTGDAGSTPAPTPAPVATVTGSESVW